MRTANPAAMRACLVCETVSSLSDDASRSRILFTDDAAPGEREENHFSRAGEYEFGYVYCLTRISSEFFFRGEA